jgi:hypothetical protein
VRGLAELMTANFQLRLAMYGREVVGPHNLRMIQARHMLSLRY